MLTGLRGRIGVGNDQVMVSGIGGLAFGWVEHTFATTNLRRSDRFAVHAITVGLNVRFWSFGQR